MKAVLAAQPGAAQGRELIGKGALDTAGMPHKLADCFKGENTELFIVEGDSAGGQGGRDHKNRPSSLRGKL